MVMPNFVIKEDNKKNKNILKKNSIKLYESFEKLYKYKDY